MKGPRALAVAIALATFVTGCQQSVPEEVELSPPETFNWTTGQPISFAPPPEEWKRSRYQNGGAEGVDFVLSGSKGEQVLIAERFFLGRRDRCATLHALLDSLETMDARSFSRELSKARPYAPEPYNEHEKRTVVRINQILSDAAAAYRRNDDFVVRRELQNALQHSASIRYSVDETVGEILFTRDRNPVYPKLEVEAPVPGEVSGEPALVVRFTFDGRGSAMEGRRIYVVKNNRMFELGFQGLAVHLPLFERIVDSVRFPPGSCEH